MALATAQRPPFDSAGTGSPATDAAGFSIDSGREPYACPMLSKRSLEIIQFVLTLASTCAVVEASRAEASPHDRPGYHVSVPAQREARDRSMSDLARTERKRREAEQQLSRRGAKLGQALTQRQSPV